MEDAKPLILVDGYCNLCNGTVRFIQKRDKNHHFQFAALQSETGLKLIEKYNISNEIDSVAMVHQHQVFIKSDVIIKASHFLPYPWKMLKFLNVIPKTWRDRLYDFIAGNRYKWFGKKEVCNYYIQTK